METKKTRPLGLLLILFVGYFSLSLSRRALQNVYTFVPAQIKGPEPTMRLGLILSSQTIGYTVTKLIAGVMIDQINPAVVFLGCLLSVAISLFCMSITSHWFIWMILYLFEGLSLGSSWPAVAKLLRLNVDQSELATWWGTISASTNFAGCVSSSLTLLVVSASSGLLDDSAWRATFLFIGLCCIISALALHLHGNCSTNSTRKSHTNGIVSTSSTESSLGLSKGDLRHRLSQSDNSLSQNNKNQSHQQMDSGEMELKHRNHLEPSSSTSTDDDLGKSKSANRKNNDGLVQSIMRLKNSLSHRQRLFLCSSAMVHLVSTFLRFVLSDWLAVILHEHGTKYSTSTVNLIISAYEVGGVLGSLFIGLLSDIMKRLIPVSNWFNSRVPLVIFQMNLAFVILIGLSFTIENGLPLSILLPSLMLLGITIFGVISLCGVVAVEFAPASLSGTSHAFTALAANIGAIIAGYPFALYANYVGWSGALWTAGAMTGISVLPLIYNRRD